MSKQVLISISENNSWGILPRGDYVDPSKAALLLARPQLYAAKLATMISNHIQILDPEIEVCAITDSIQKEKVRLNFGGDWKQDEIQLLIASVKDFSMKIWNQPLSENLFELNKIERNPFKRLKRKLDWTATTEGTAVSRRS